MNPTPQYPSPQPRKRPRWLIPVIAGGGAVVLLCCIGMVAVLATGDDPDSGESTVAGEPSPTAAPRTSDRTAPRDRPTEPPEPAPEPPEPAGFGAGIWEVGAEVPPGTYVTTVPEGGVFDSCYWARLSGFSGDFDELIANDNLNAGARGRLTISESDAGVEFTGGCRWVEVSEADPVELGNEVGEGVWAVGDEVRPGTYVTEVPEGGTFDSCYWARLSGFSGEFDDLIANDNLDAGTRGRVEIAASDAGVQFTGGCTWTRS